MGEYLAHLSHSSFRTASRLLSDSVLPSLQGEAFWRAFGYLSLLSPRAYLGTCLKAAARAYAAGGIRFEGEALEAYALRVREKEMNIDRGKFLRAALPLLREREEFAEVWRLMGIDDARRRVEWLTLHGAAGAEAYYELLQEAKRVGDDEEFLRRTIYALIRKGDALSYNMASIVRAYFGVSGVEVTFSLRLEPYQISRLDEGREKFTQLLTGI